MAKAPVETPIVTGETKIISKRSQLKRIFISLSFFIMCSVVHAASFDCAKASNHIENTICSDSVLSDLDSQLMQSYKKSLSASANADSVKSEQRTWLKEIRNKCSDAECLKSAYFERIAGLDGREIKTGSNETTELATKSSSPEPINATSVASIQPEQNTPNNKVSDPVNTTSDPASSSQSVMQSNSDAQSASASGATAAKFSANPGSDTKPASPLSDFIESASRLIILIPLIGLIKPAWVYRWDKNPTRTKAFGYFLVTGIFMVGLSLLARNDERKAYDAKLQAENRAASDAREAQREKEKAEREANRQGIKLYEYYKSVKGNQDRPGYDEQEFIKGNLISTCNINGRPRGKYGWIEFRTVFLDGYRIKDSPITRMYIFAVVDGDNASVMWRGEQYMQELSDEMKRTCD